MAIEVMAQRVMNYTGGLDYIVEEHQLDLIRNHARYGNPRKWPYNIRRIYPADRQIFDAEGKYILKVHFRTTPRTIKKNKLYTIEEDEEGFQIVKRYKINWNI